MSENNYKYYAFISYSRKNSKGAAFLHRGLEHFKIPHQKVDPNLLPPHKKYLKPVFRDKRDLEVSEKNFSENLQNAIQNSRYLLVLCSVESAVSRWVNEEIKHFLETHENRYELIVPVILNGTPGSGDESECLPEILRKEEIINRNLPSMIPDDEESRKEGWEDGVLQTISYMLHVKRENLKESVDAEKIRFYKRCTTIAVLALVIFIGLTTWAVWAENKAKANEERAISEEKKARESDRRARESAEKYQKLEEELKYYKSRLHATDNTWQNQPTAGTAPQTNPAGKNQPPPEPVLQTNPAGKNQVQKNQ